MSNYEERCVSAARARLEAAWDLLGRGAYRAASLEARDASEITEVLDAVLVAQAARERKEAKQP